jgi:MarR family transcriptional regulator, temperature-dependent positive regulator of motility
MIDNLDMPGHLARRFQQIAVSVFHAETEARGFNLTPVQYAALVAVNAHPEIDQATLAGLIAHDRTTITGVIDRLARKGLLERKVNEADRRSRALRITGAGIAILDEIEPAVVAAQETILSGLEQSEADQLIALLRKAIDSLNDRSRAPQRKI